VRGDEGVLDGVLGLLEGAEHVPAEGQDPAVVAVVDGLERAGVTGSDESYEFLVACEAQTSARPSDGARCCWQCGGGHDQRSNTPTQRAPAREVGV
jgi:hypothetical protein